MTILNSTILNPTTTNNTDNQQMALTRQTYKSEDSMCCTR